MSNATLVLDARTSRIVHFTALDPSCLPMIDGNLIVSLDSASLPPDMDTVNSYQFTYKHGQITQDKPPAKGKPQSLLEANREALYRQLRVNLARDWSALSPWDRDAASPERAAKFVDMEMAYKARIQSAATQAEIDELATAIAAIKLA